MSKGLTKSRIVQSIIYVYAEDSRTLDIYFLNEYSLSGKVFDGHDAATK